MSETACAAVISILVQILGWLIRWLYYVCLICLIGACVGIVTHLLFGVLFMEEPDYGFQAAFGFLNGFKYAGVWAGGAAIVLCVIKARKAHLLKTGTVGGNNYGH